jgi:hypothetical protein
VSFGYFSSGIAAFSVVRYFRRRSLSAADPRVVPEIIVRRSRFPLAETRYPE